MYNTLKIISLHSAEQKNCQQKTYLAIRATEEKIHLVEVYYTSIGKGKENKGKQNSDKSENGKKFTWLIRRKRIQ